jgi:4-aminobutyrate aminotransferase
VRDVAAFQYADRRRNLAPALARATDLQIARGAGPFLFDESGRKFLDFTSGIGVTNTGHCHPRVVAAVKEQAERLLHGQAGVVYHEPMLRLIDELLRLVPEGLDSFFFANSGAEAVEASVKLARRATRRPNVVVFQGGFHGRTLGAVSLTTSKAIYRTGYQPLMAGIAVAPYPYAYRYGLAEDDVLAWCLTELRRLFEMQTAPEETAAILVEPVLGEGGYVVPPLGFLPALRELCDEHDLLLIVDEVQTGFGRTGRFFAVEHTRIRPDVVVMAKAMASGLPLSAIAIRPDLAARWPPGSHGSTFGGNPVACAAAIATIEVIQTEGLIENARRMGEHLLEALRHASTQCEFIRDVRGLGLMIGVEFRKLGQRSAGEVAREVQRRCVEEGLLLLTCGTEDQVIRWIPPLIVGEQEIDAALEVFGSVVSRLGSGWTFAHRV